MRSFVFRKKVLPNVYLYVSPLYIVRLLYKLTLCSHSEYAAQKEDITNAIKANYEKVLNTERTLKTQVKMHLCG